MGIEKKGEDGPTTDGATVAEGGPLKGRTTSVSKEEKRLHLRIDHARNRTFSASPADPQAAMTISPNPMFPFSQPNSPISDETQQPQLVTSPGSVLSTPMSVGHPPLLNRTVSDESGNQRFFMLRKDSERRHTLANFMTEYKEEIVHIWFNQLMQNAKSTIYVTRNMLRTLLDGMRNYLLSKDVQPIKDCLNDLRTLLDYEPTAISQINLALYDFSDAMQPVLRKLIIKPHWMFALDNLIRSAVQTAVQILSPDLSAVLQVHDINSPSTSGVQRPSVSRESAVSEAETGDSRPPSAPPAFDSSVVRERRDNLKNVHEENRQLFDQLLEVERELNTLLRLVIDDKRRKISTLREVSERPMPPLQGLSTLPNGMANGSATSSSAPSPQNSLPKHADELVTWLRSLDVDDHSIACIIREGYTKPDILEYVGREELRQCGVAGGASCRILRACQEARSRRGHVLLSPPLRSRDDSLDDYHSSMADDVTTDVQYHH